MRRGRARERSALHRRRHHRRRRRRRRRPLRSQPRLGRRRRPRDDRSGSNSGSGTATTTQRRREETTDEAHPDQPARNGRSRAASLAAVAKSASDGPDGPRDRGQLLDPPLGEAEARHGEVHRPERLRTTATTSGSAAAARPGRRASSARPALASLTAVLKKGVKLHLLVRDRRPPLGGHARQLRRPLGAMSAGAPSRPAAPPSVSRRGRAYSGMAHTKRTILLVEDEESITTPLAEALERDGFHAEVAHTVADGLAQGRTRAARPRPARHRAAGRLRARRLPGAARVARASRSSSSRRAGRRPTASSGSSSAPTTTSSSRSAPAR